ncbi:5-amino-6-(5-phospho-D-ribitylamino)uracil phosphatase YigB [Yersinia nurmii]|uniref:5-amino-6-(5-phospho-D-ribitylamino)uracil phosphatase YigB n=1 Tax=Yersinia nurmii TaxID=685706 RepID=A0AAW7K7Z0_9GAMM|nr:5-amino-6-(5-phospho-D-ribitylamino)uracil phosphatase YigB [Yersinia nurmii]MDN0089084.1 5-amino-6-(5-phospho-D-ribitylamino)uracil phosphatase YigB [Yersinia nurmii]CNF01768.1 flavin mononucleotide phosphatase [Yersinia nurmii]
MHFYRPLQPIAAITFDLDDTLYDNRPVITRTEQESMAFLQQYHPNLRQFEVADFHRFRTELLASDPDIYHDVTQWRWLALELGLVRHGLTKDEARKGADAVMENFALWRSRIYVPAATHDTLEALSERFPLVAITNGNADPAACGLSRYFQFVLRSGPNGRAKPYRDMYQKAANKLDLPLESILHVGDDLTTDVAGSLRCGMQACWINDRQKNIMAVNDARLLPHIEISQLASLTALL